MKNNKKGFTLAELLIVVAIIAVLVAIAIPVFTAQLEKSREAVDLANLRSAYAECTTAVLTETNTGNATYAEATGTAGASASESVDMVQETDGWEGNNGDITIGGTKVPDTSTGSVTITVNDKGVVSFG